MIKWDEIELMQKAIAVRGSPQGNLIEAVGESKRLHYVLRKWDGKDWWDYGVSLRGGWLTDKGEEEMLKILKQPMYQYGIDSFLRDNSPLKFRLRRLLKVFRNGLNNLFEGF